MSMDPDPTVVIPKVQRLILNPLEAALRCGSVKRFVLTSSSSAAVLPVPNKQMIVDESM